MWVCPCSASRLEPHILSRPALKLACLRRIAAADLDEIQRFLLVHCVQFYLELTRAEAAEYEALRAREQDREVEVMAMNWVERLENQYERAGRKEGKREGIRQAGSLAPAGPPLRSPAERRPQPDRGDLLGCPPEPPRREGRGRGLSGGDGARVATAAPGPLCEHRLPPP